MPSSGEYLWDYDVLSIVMSPVFSRWFHVKVSMVAGVGFFTDA